MGGCCPQPPHQGAAAPLTPALKWKYSYKVKCSLIDTETKVTNNHGPKQDGPNRDGSECRAQMAIVAGPNGMGRIGMWPYCAGTFGLWASVWNGFFLVFLAVTIWPCCYAVIIAATIDVTTLQSIAVNFNVISASRFQSTYDDDNIDDDDVTHYWFWKHFGSLHFTM